MPSNSSLQLSFDFHAFLAGPGLFHITNAIDVWLALHLSRLSSKVKQYATLDPALDKKPSDSTRKSVVRVV